jgi:uncharacterized protein (TIGR02594 family)
MSIAAITGPKLYRFGDSGDAVKAIQIALRDKGGYALKGTGYFGTQTDAAVEDFQERNGLTKDGVFGPKTAAKLDAIGNVVKTENASAPLWLTVSLSNVGMKEAPGAANNKELIADIKTVAKDYQNDATPWCAGWVSFCLVRAGEKPSSLPLWALSYSDTKNEPLVRLPGPALGAIAVKKRNGGGHVTFVAGRTKGGALACCGGNQNDEVNVSPYAESVFMGFFWPKGAPLPARSDFWSLPIVNTLGRLVSSEA